MNYWLLKSEPSEFSITDLERVHESVWDGVRNYQVRNSFRDVMQAGDKALFYHSSCADIGVVGEMEIVIPAIPDPTQFNQKSKYFDPKSTGENPRWLGPKVRFVKKFTNIVTLTEIKNNPIFSDIPLTKRGNRLSAFPISKKHYDAIAKMAGK
jgi:predicted RNA-binding protein with PUA-like domain